MTVTTKLIDTIFSLSRCMREKTGSKSQVAELSMVQIQTLIFLAKSPASMKDIAQYLHIELPSATSLIDHLVEMNFVLRKQDAKDKRSIQISLTTTGKQLLQKAKKAKKERLARFFSTLSIEEKKQLLSILQKLQKTLEAIHEK